LDDLPQNGLRPETPALLRELFHACNQYRYTPEHTSRELTSLIPKVKTALHGLQAMPATPTRTSFPQGVGLVLLLLLGTMTLWAEPVTEEFTQANKFYEEGKYTRLRPRMKRLPGPEMFPLRSISISATPGSKPVRWGGPFGLSSSGGPGPRDPDIRANLQIVRTQAGANNSALPGNRRTRWIGRLTLNEWTVTASEPLRFFFWSWTVREIWPGLKKSGAALTPVLGFACLGLGVCLGLAVEQRLIEKYSVVIVPEAVARRGPLPESQSAFTVHDGAELLVLGNDGDWLQVTTPPTTSAGWHKKKWHPFPRRPTRTANFSAVPQPVLRNNTRESYTNRPDMSSKTAKPRIHRSTAGSLTGPKSKCWIAPFATAD